MCVKFLFYFSIKTYFFYFTRSFLQNTHIKLYIIHPFLFKYLFIIIIFTFIFSYVLSSLNSLLFKIQTTAKLPWLNLHSQNSNSHHKGKPPWLGLHFLHLLLSLFAIVVAAYPMLSMLFFLLLL